MIQVQLDKILFLDIETVPQTESLEELSPEIQHLWDDKFTLLKQKMSGKYSPETTSTEGFATSAGIYAEFGKIVCISVGFIHFKGSKKYLRVKSFAGSDEKQLLTDFADLVGKFLTTPQHNVCGHNIKEFDVPFICRRMLVNGLVIPASLDVMGKKPWETSLLDTMEMWKFGDYKSYTSLKLLTAIFGIPTPKDDIDGSQVANVFYKENDVKRIATYCEKDVIATTRLFLKMNNFDTIADENIEHV